MQWRRFLYIIAIGLIAFLVLNYNDGNQEVDLPVITQEEILDDFQKESGEIWVSFPADFDGNSDDLFYVGKHVEGKNITTVYKIYSSESGQLAYQTHDQWDNVKLPENRFETYHLIDGKWVKQKMK